MSRNEKNYAVLTGDLVKSSRLSTTDSLGAMEILKTTAEAFAVQHPDAVIGRMDTFRHDSWQLLLEQPVFAFRAAIFFRAALKRASDADTKYDTRVSIGIGAVEWISKQRVSDSRGPAFTLSGKGLDAMDGRCLTLDAGDHAPDSLRSFGNTAVPLLDCVVGDWTPSESRAVYGALMEFTHEEIARHWPPVGKTGRPPSRQAVGDALMRAHWSTVDDVLRWIGAEIGQAYGLA